MQRGWKVRQNRGSAAAQVEEVTYEQSRIRAGLAGHRRGRRCCTRNKRVAPRRDHQRRVAGRRRGVRILDRLPLLQPLHRQPRAPARCDAGDAGRQVQRRPRLRTDQQVHPLRSPFRGDRRRRPVGGAGAGGADGLPARYTVDPGWRFAGAVQDFMILFISVRRDGRSLGDMIKSELGEVPGLIALFGVLMIMIIILAVLALVVVKALAVSPWGTFTVFVTIPIAMFMGIYLRFIRPGRVLEMSIIGFVLLMAGIIFGQNVSESPTLAPLFTISAPSLALILLVYGFVA